jgi:hypothetical protein
MTRCKENYKRCSREPISPSPMPTRVLVIGNLLTPPRIFVTQGKNREYATLSYCWNEVKGFTFRAGRRFADGLWWPIAATTARRCQASLQKSPATLPRTLSRLTQCGKPNPRMPWCQWWGHQARKRNDSLARILFLASVPGFRVGSHPAYWKPALSVLFAETIMEINGRYFIYKTKASLIV